jgi:hypothetical protein
LAAETLTIFVVQIDIDLTVAPAVFEPDDAAPLMAVRMARAWNWTSA